MPECGVVVGRYLLKVYSKQVLLDLGPASFKHQVGSTLHKDAQPDQPACGGGTLGR